MEVDPLINLLFSYDLYEAELLLRIILGRSRVPDLEVPCPQNDFPSNYEHSHADTCRYSDGSIVMEVLLRIIM